ncbi:hypothetical protein GCM10010503_41550 [Streptomyces lucensis JCM 4490]|uniref:Lipoprotein n=1 Tax=Streptomyces lucensis JCM 4490 TaxID=1306176 RepID=A0A918JAP9_9ACTN|nr:hypothetical protein [Streptomyces lucensis]GGW60002.1 hypothetical protein GCM10010503_41550 [Streptomyces lucensis JCM 4490]
MKSHRATTTTGIAAIGLAAAVLLSGCGAAPDGRPSGRHPAASSREPSPAESRTLARAEQVLISRCMDARGFRYEVTDVVGASGDGARSFPYAVDDVAWARAHGYGGREERSRARALEVDPNQRYFHRLSPSARVAARTALTGASPVGLSVKAPTGVTITASDEGCIADAERTLYGDLEGWFRVKVVTMNLRPVRETRVHRDRRYTDAVGRWAACMRKAGRPYTSPDESRQAAARFGESLPAPEADAAGTALAVVEATCATSTPLARVSHALDHSYGERLREQYREELAERWRFQNAALPMARRLVPPSPSASPGKTEPSGGSHA